MSPVHHSPLSKRSAAFLAGRATLVRTMATEVARVASVAGVMGALLASSLSACDGGTPSPADTTMSVEELMKPETCRECHAQHYREWASSMHAYAAKDPIFLAMNARGQEETNGKLGTFCVQCHAPIAVAQGLTKDGLNLDELPEETKGVTCYFCHNVASIAETHDNPLGLPANNPLQLAMDTVMRGGLGRPGDPNNPPPAHSPAHGVAYSGLLDGNDMQSATMCGSCHDIVTPAGVHLERTFHEWRNSKMGDPNTRESDQLSCNSCHMRGRSGVVADSDRLQQVPFRRGGVHSHLFPGLDVALTDHPDKAIQKMAIECELADAAVGYKLTVGPGNVVVSLESPGLGHMWPSGATQDRRGYLQITAYDGDGKVIGKSGHVALDQSVMEASAADPTMTVFRDTMYDADDNEVHMFWDATRTSDNPNLLPGSPADVAPGVRAPHTAQYGVARLFNPAIKPARVEAQVFVRPIGHEVIEDLLDSGHLRDLGYDESLIDQIPTFALSDSRMVWDGDKQEIGDTVTQISPLTESGCQKRVQCALYPELCDE